MECHLCGSRTVKHLLTEDFDDSFTSIIRGDSGLNEVPWKAVWDVVNEVMVFDLTTVKYQGSRIEFWTHISIGSNILLDLIQRK